MLNEFISEIEKLLIIDFKQLIDKNYEIAYEYLNEEKDILYSKGGDVYLGSTFVNKYYEFVKVFSQFMSLSFSEEFFNLIETNFYKVKNYLLNYTSNELKKLNKYNFNDEIKKKNFYFIEQLYNEMNNIIQNINEYFNEEKYNILVKVYILNISTEIIKTYDDKKAKQMQNYYDNLSNKVSGKVYSSDSDVVRLVTKSKRKWYGKKKTWVEVEKYYCKNYRNNIQKVTKDISMINNTMVEKIDNLINIYIQKFDIYLQNYIKLSQSLYTYIYIYYENNIKDHQNIKSGLNKCMNLLDDILINDLNEKLFSKIIGKVNINNEINYCIQNLDNNIRQIYEIYYKLNYLKDYEDFFLYLEEIKYKLENILNELKKASNQIKTKINSSYNNRILNIIKSTNKLII